MICVGVYCKVEAFLIKRKGHPLKLLFSFLVLFGLGAAGAVQAATIGGNFSSTTIVLTMPSAQGKLAKVRVRPSVASPTLPDAYIALNAPVAGCSSGLMNIANASSDYGRALVAAALSAQSADSSVSVTYNPALNCKVLRLVVVPPPVD